MFRDILKIASKIIGIGFLLLAFIQWLTFGYPDVNPFWPGAIFAPGLISQFFNWIFVCILGAIGWGFFTLGKFKLEKSSNDPQK